MDVEYQMLNTFPHVLTMRSLFFSLTKAHGGLLRGHHLKSLAPNEYTTPLLLFDRVWWGGGGGCAPFSPPGTQSFPLLPEAGRKMSDLQRRETLLRAQGQRNTFHRRACSQVIGHLVGLEG